MYENAPLARRLRLAWPILRVFTRANPSPSPRNKPATVSIEDNNGYLPTFAKDEK